MKDSRRRIGIVGGMGPRAGVELARLCVSLADCHDDQEHPDVLLISRPSGIPDRTEYLAGRTSQNPGSAIADVICELAELGATDIGVPCNTSHAGPIMAEIMLGLQRRACTCRVHNLLDAAVNAALELSLLHRIGLLATTGTMSQGLYDTVLQRAGAEVVRPAEDTQRAVHECIYHRDWGIKSHSDPVTERATQGVVAACNELIERGSDCVILGCTELPLIPDLQKRVAVPLVDPSRELALVLLRACGVPRRLGVDRAVI